VDVVRRLLRTEKGTRTLAQRKYLFAVSLKATKPQIKQAVGELFKVKVTKVATAVMAGKPRRVGARWGYRPRWKKAVVTLAEGSKIEMAT
jgi:large subunit ribosomal protein L23